MNRRVAASSLSAAVSPPSYRREGSRSFPAVRARRESETDRSAGRRSSRSLRRESAGWIVTKRRIQALVRVLLVLDCAQPLAIGYPPWWRARALGEVATSVRGPLS